MSWGAGVGAEGQKEAQGAALFRLHLGSQDKDKAGLPSLNLSALVLLT